MVCTRHLLKQRSKVFVRCRRACNKILTVFAAVEIMSLNAELEIFTQRFSW